MSAAGPYTDNLIEVKTELRELKAMMIKVAKQVDIIYREDYEDVNTQDIDQMTAEEQIRKYGQKVPYNMIDDPVDVARFREFLHDARRKGSNLKPLERDMIDIADKNFEDIRLSSKHLMILKGVYQKLYSRVFPFKYKQGYMYKLENYQPEWEWFQ